MTRRRQKPIATAPDGKAVPVKDVIQACMNRTAMAIEAKNNLEDEVRVWRLLATAMCLRLGGQFQMNMDEMAKMEEAFLSREAEYDCEIFLGSEDQPTVLKVRRR